MATVRYELGYASAIAVVLFAMMAFTRLIIGKSFEYGQQVGGFEMIKKLYYKFNTVKPAEKVQCSYTLYPLNLRQYMLLCADNRCRAFQYAAADYTRL